MFHVKPYYLWSERRRYRFWRTVAVLLCVALPLILTLCIPATFGGGCQ